ncbi:MAG: TolC family protein [Bacteroidetes bacterium]|nr:MAG: TolC family protein [Bacteroidota bacterium]
MQGNSLQNGNIAGASDRFNGFVATISVPLFYGSYKNQIKQMSISQAQSEIKYEYAKNQLYLQFEQLLQNYLIKKNNLNFYQNTALKQAEEIRKTAVSAYNSQAIGYIELIQLLEQSYQIKQEYLQALQAYNNSIIELNYLLNK